MTAHDNNLQARDARLVQLLDEEREKLRRDAGLPGLQRPLRPVENPFTAAERDRVTLLIGGLTWKHEEFIRAVFEGSGYRCQRLPTPTLADFQAGKDYGNKGQCNPAYFTVGSLISYLRGLEESGLSREQIVRDYVFFTAGSCGPCRFGMYEAEYRLALQNAGFEGFRVLLFQQTDGIHAASGEPGLKFTVDFGMGMLNALNLGDAIHDISYRVRPFEVNPGETDRVIREAGNQLAATLRGRSRWHITTATPPWLRGMLELRPKVTGVLCTLGKVAHNLYAKEYVDALAACREQINAIEVDRLRVKPVVKIVGEFWAQTTEGDGNFNIFALLEREGAQVLPEPIATWISYMLYLAAEHARDRKDVRAPYKDPRTYEIGKKLANEWQVAKKTLPLQMGSALWTHFYYRTLGHLGGVTHRLVPQKELARLAHPHFHKLAEGGEGYMEVGKNIYYSSHHLCHMVLGLKPFGCMPSSQSDGVQSRIVSCYKDMIFLPIETSGEGEVNAHSRVQMALAEAKAKARAEFERELDRTGRSLDELHEYVAEHGEMQRALYRFPHREGIAGTAAQFAWHIHDRMTADASVWRRIRVVVPRPIRGWKAPSHTPNEAVLKRQRRQTALSEK